MENTCNYGFCSNSLSRHELCQELFLWENYKIYESDHQYLGTTVGRERTYKRELWLIHKINKKAATHEGNALPLVQ